MRRRPGNYGTSATNAASLSLQQMMIHTSSILIQDVENVLGRLQPRGRSRPG
jgi:hypothetical protein